MTAAIVTLIVGVIIVCVSFFIIDGHNYKEEDEIYSETSDELRRRLMDLSDDLYRKYRENVKSLNEELRIKLERKILIELEKYAGQLSEKAKNEMISYINESLADAFAAYNTDDNAEPKEITYDAEEDAPVMKLGDEAPDTVSEETVTSEEIMEEPVASEETPEEPVVSETVPKEQDTEEQVQAEEAVASEPASEISETTPEEQPVEEQPAEELETLEAQPVDEQAAAEPEMPETQPAEEQTVNEQQVQHNNGKKKRKKKNKNRNNNTKPEISETPVIEPEKIWDEEEDMEKKVMELSENGCSIMEIANQLGIGVGEAKTILNRQK